MKKTNHIKTIALIVTVLMLLQALGASCIITTSAANNQSITYETKFDDSFDTLKATGLWAVEPQVGPKMSLSLKPTEPTVANGVMKFDSKDAVIFNWVDKIGGEGAYDSTKKYVFEFDVKVTDSGNGFQWSSNSTSYTRVMYVGYGGWFNQIEINTNATQFRVGDTYIDYTDAALKNKTIHYEIVLEGETSTTTAYNADGSVFSSGSRTSGDYDSMSSANGAMKTLAIRCEDGAFELDNFSFSAEQTATADENSTQIDIPTGKQAIYTAKLNFARGDNYTVKLGSKELFSMAAAGIMKIGGAQVQGSYAAGEYTVKAYINPTQQMVIVEVTLPDGGIVRRGSFDLLGGTSVSISANDESKVGEVGVIYEDITKANYKLTNTEPTASGFGSKVYNLISSFSNASTDRLFAWTAKAEYIGNEAMAVKYREKGAADWTTVDATRTVEKTKVDAEDYFKAEIKDLKANTEYEYKIGKKASSSDSDWSEIYSFTTAAENVKDFSFIAIGDPQGYMWDHFKYAKAALDEAIKQVPNPAFILNTGDIVDSGYEAYQWNRYFKALGNLGTTIPHFAAIGNHDTKNAADVQNNNNKNNYFSFYFNHPDAPADAIVMDPSVLAGLSASGKVQVNDFNETVYSYNYGDAHFIVLNTGTYVNTGNLTYIDDKPIIEAQRAWLEKELEANKDAKWTIIMVHEAMYHRAGGVQDRTYLTDIVEKYGVDLVIEGHSHLVTRTYPMKDGKIVTKSSPDVIEKGIGTVYMTIGATTTGHDSLGTSNVEKMVNIVTPDSTQPVYTLVEIKGNDLILTTKQINGLVVDTFTIKGEALPEGETTETGDDTPATDVPVTENDTTDTPAAEDKGCGAAVSAYSLAVVALIGTCTVFVTKKKED